MSYMLLKTRLSAIRCHSIRWEMTCFVRTSSDLIVTLLAKFWSERFVYTSLSA